ncbi:hypothetical protein AYO20_03638 [Fonsecaea nubica]|uniref:Hemerythrin-like domain-containing protein n=1 Tax=Fonsecaea nubica TaxID=856822 RepID=A0A178D4L7_9EURO|nr:hypothetical protein AYO20_03638 [Fonsecaea nubica]OAL37160.1 hypothetical protein AYO20_03638 [Fonsecaea nubica]
MLAILIALLQQTSTRFLRPSTPIQILRVNAANNFQTLRAKVPLWIGGTGLSQTALPGTVSHAPTFSRYISSIPTNPTTTSMASQECGIGPEQCTPGQKAGVQADLSPASNNKNADTDAKTDAAAAEPEPELPKLSAQDFREYNRLAVMMNAYDFPPTVCFVPKQLVPWNGGLSNPPAHPFSRKQRPTNKHAQHNHFRYTWNLLYKACTSGSRPAGMSIRSFISQGLHLCHSLTIHHTIEEQHVFPELAERMPAFGAHDHLITQHGQIHEGLDKLEAYLDACRGGEKELRLSELKEIMDSFGGVLWAHLDDEVRMLGAENMRRFWTKEEIMAMQW